jgi:hypothetical protein
MISMELISTIKSKLVNAWCHIFRMDNNTPHVFISNQIPIILNHRNKLQVTSRRPVRCGHPIWITPSQISHCRRAVRCGLSLDWGLVAELGDQPVIVRLGPRLTGAIALFWAATSRDRAGAAVWASTAGAPRPDFEATNTDADTAGLQTCEPACRILKASALSLLSLPVGKQAIGVGHELVPAP